MSELYEMLTLLLRQISALFEALYQLEGGSGDKDILTLCCLGEDLAREAQRRVNRLYDEV